MEAFNLAATYETLIGAALSDKTDEIKKSLAVANNGEKSHVTIDLGPYGELGEIEKSQAFQQFRQDVLKENPEIKDVRAMKLHFHFLGDRACAVFWLKEPTLARRIGFQLVS